ncbi:DsbA family protein [Nonomuraea jiangxiensis]|uniref:Thioredoxin n=1 Tax=Nonomuraea jiangxiensis TaxID=633440 RepID=A0A1G9MTN9_9ACTN|nr:hypothetical protein [Nonomuraea jiangxiensis]SDL77652.1 hypothetical protein SAMN05421869_130115 [Nonomuraea jiangxiensis]
MRHHRGQLLGWAVAEESEAAAAQDRFLDFARAIFDDQDSQWPSDIITIALDAEAMNITAIPALFINGRRHIGPYDAQSLLRALTTRTDTPAAQ